MSRLALKTSLEAVQTVSAIYTGGTVQLSSDCVTLFTPCNNTIKLINVSDGKEICTFGSEEDSEITTCLLTPDSQQLFVAHKNLLLKLWDVGEKKLVRTWKTIHTAPIVCLAYQSGFLATGSADFTVKVWNLQKQQCVHNLKGANSVVTTVSFFATTNRGEKQDGKLLVYGTADGKVRVSNLKESRYEAVLETHTSAITSIRMDEDGKFLIVAGRDQIVTVWNRENYTLKKTIPIYEAIESMEVVNRSLLNLMTLPVEVGTDAADVYFLTGGEGKSLKLWSFAKGLAVHTCKGAMSGGISQIFLRPDGAKVSLVTDDHNILFLDGKTLETEKQLVGNNDEILDLTFFGDSELLVATNSPQLRLYELNSLSCTLLSGHTDSVMSLAVARWDSSVFASGSKDNSFRLWKSAKHEGDVVKVVCLAEGTGHTNSITAVKFSTTGPHWIATTSSDMTLKLWGIGDLMRKKTDSADSHLHALTTVVAHSKDISCIDVSPNDKLIATGSMDKTVKVWSVVDRGKKAPVSLELIGTITGHRRGVWDLQFSPYDTVVATASGDLTVKLFSLGDYSCVKTFEGHTCTVTKVCFLPSGLQLLSADTGGLLKMWTIKTSECVKTFDGHNDKIWAMDIKTLGRQGTDEEKEERRDVGDFIVGTGGSDSVWKLWRDTTDVEKEEEAKKRDETVQQEQTLANLMVQKKFVKALRLAVTLNRPHNAFKIVKEIMSDAEGVDLDEKLSALEGAIERLNSDQINVLLGYAVEWNTTAKSCLVGQSVLSVLLRLFSPEELMKLSGLSAAVEALIPYTERHFERLTRLRQQSTFIDYTWRCMRLPDQATLALNNMEADESERSSSGMVNFHDGDFDEEILAYTDLYWLNFDRPPKWVLYAMGLFIANLCLVAIVVIHSTWKNSSLSNPWVTNVRISSVLFCVTNAFSVASCFNGIWMFGHTGCQLYALAQGYFALVTFMSLVGGVANLPDKKSSSVASQIIWIYTLVILLPPFFGWGHYHLSGYLVTCCFEHAVADWNNKSYVWFLYWTGFVSPLAFLLKNGVNQAGSLEATMLRKALGSYLVLWMPYAIMGFAGVTFPQSFTITPTMESLVTTFSKIFVLCLPLAEIHTLQKMRKVQ